MSARLVFLAGKMAAGKSTLARKLAGDLDAVLLVQDEFLERLFPGEITDIDAFLRCATRIQGALAPLVCEILSRGLAVVLDFPANTKRQRAWFRALIDRSGVEHELHFIDASDALCKRQLHERSRHLAPGTPWTTEAEFEAITKYFEPPSVDEGFSVVRYERG
jgi:predicted kinase